MFLDDKKHSICGEQKLQPVLFNSHFKIHKMQVKKILMEIVNRITVKCHKKEKIPIKGKNV